MISFMPCTGPLPVVTPAAGPEIKMGFGGGVAAMWSEFLELKIPFADPYYKDDA